MSFQRLVKQEVEESGVTNFSVTDCFTTDYKIYKVILDKINPSTSNYVHVRMVDTSNSTISSSEYDVAIYSLFSYGSYASEGRAQNGTKWDNQLYANTDSDNGALAVLYIYNPMDSIYTFLQGESVGQDGDIGGKTIGVLKNTLQCSGLTIFPNSGTLDDARVRVFGLRIE